MRHENLDYRVQQSAIGSKIREPRQRPVRHDVFPVEQSIAEKHLHHAFTAEVTSNYPRQQELFSGMERENQISAHRIASNFQIFEMAYPEQAGFYFFGAVGGYHAFRQVAARSGGRLLNISEVMIEDATVEMLNGEEVYNTLVLERILSDKPTGKVFFLSP